MASCVCSRDHLHPGACLGFVRLSEELFAHGLDELGQGLDGQQTLLLQVSHGPVPHGLQVPPTGTVGWLYNLLTDTRPRQRQGLALLPHSWKGGRLETLGMEVPESEALRFPPLCVYQCSVYRVATEQRYNNPSMIQ